MIDAEDARKITEGRYSCRDIWYTLEYFIRKRANAGLFEYKYKCINESEAKEIANNLHYGHNYVCDVDGNQITIKW